MLKTLKIYDTLHTVDATGDSGTVFDLVAHRASPPYSLFVVSSNGGTAPAAVTVDARLAQSPNESQFVTVASITQITAVGTQSAVKDSAIQTAQFVKAIVDVDLTTPNGGTQVEVWLSFEVPS